MMPRRVRETQIIQERSADEHVSSEGFVPRSGNPHFVYFYVIGPDNGEELRISIRSIEKYVHCEAKITVIGEKPNWYNGHFLNCPKLGRTRGDPLNRTAFRDTHHKIQITARNPEIDEQFIWIMDDVYFLKPTTIDDLLIARHDPWWRSKNGSEWHRLISRTHTTLRVKGYPTLQYATHLPHVFEKQKLLQMFEEFNFRNNLLLFEVLYGNRWRTSDTTYQGFLSRWQTVPHVNHLDAQQQHVMNYVSSVWRPTIREWLQKKFPERSRFEA